MAMTRVKTEKEIENMRVSGRMLATVLDLLRSKVGEGQTTKEIAILASKELNLLGGEPAFLGFNGFPDVICISVNEEIVHGVPSKSRVIKKGDLLSLDFGVSYQGMITDSAITVAVSGSDPQDLIATTERSLYAGIDTIKSGVHIGDIGQAVEQVLSQQDFGIVRDLVGHGVGHELHEEPNIPNYGHAGAGISLKEGMTVAIEPMATLGAEEVIIDNDGWTIKTRDNSLSAHFEHTILVKDNGYEILTALPGSKD